MSAALYVVLDSPEPGFDVTVDGKALSAAEPILARAASALGVTPLMEFFSISNDELALAAEDFGLDDEQIGDVGPVTWFEPEAGLRSVRALVAYVLREPHTVESPDAVLEDLRQFERVLVEAERRGLKWRVAIDL